jgi:poly(A) polymerase
LVLLVAADGGIAQSRLAELLHLARDWTPPVFPLAGRDVTALGIPPGERVGQLLAGVREWWEEGDFTANRRSCLAHLEELDESTR